MNINTKFIGTGGSNLSFYPDTSSLAPKKQLSLPKPPVSGIFKCETYLFCYQRKLIHEQTLFRKYYDRGDLPVAVSFVGALRKLTWKL